MTRKARQGFTLIETLFVLGILGVLGAAVAAFQRDTIGLNSIIQDSLSSQQEMRTTVKDFLSEARSAGPSATGAYPLATAATSTFMFYSDIDLDGARERIRYFLSGTTLRKGVVKPTGSPPTYDASTEQVSDVVHGVVDDGNPIFEYYDAGYDGTSMPLAQPVDIPSVRLVKISLTSDRDPLRPPGPVSITAQASFRNLKDNL